MASQKTEIIEEIFYSRFEKATGVLSDPLVTIAQLGEAIRRSNARHPDAKENLSPGNPANFIKDIVRKRSSANRNWPQSVFKSGYTGRQVTGDGRAFEYIPITPGQKEPFPAPNFAHPPEGTPVHIIESVSLPLASRRLGRSDEPWMIQVVTKLRVIETHFSLVSAHAIKQLDLLQLNVKLRGTEIDALFLAHEEREEKINGEPTYEEVIVTCEAKSASEDLVETQIISQAKGAFEKLRITQNRVIPIAVKCIPPSTLYVLEFEALERSTYKEVDTLVVAGQSLFKLEPPVPGICK